MQKFILDKTITTRVLVVALMVGGAGAAAGQESATRRFHSFRHAASEAGMSRVHGGIHFLRAVKDGLRPGTAIGRDMSGMLPPVQKPQPE